MMTVHSVLRVLKEPSSWGGFAVLAGVAGIQFEQWQAIAHAGAAVAAALAVVLPEAGR